MNTVELTRERLEELTCDAIDPTPEEVVAMAQELLKHRPKKKRTLKAK